MADPVYIGNGTSSISVDEFEKYGHPGKFMTTVSVVSGSTLYCTGSNYGVGGLIVASGISGSWKTSNGGTGSLAHLAAGYIHELSLEYVSVTSGTAYVLVRNQHVR